jgi:hypothetical protein
MPEPPPSFTAVDQKKRMSKRESQSVAASDRRPRTVATLSEPSFIDAKKRGLEIFPREVRR